MKFSKTQISLGISVILIIICVFTIYWNLVNTFWTQDEWWELGRAVDARTQGIGYYFKPWGGHLVPLMLLCVNLQFALFGMNIVPYALLAMSGHALFSIMLTFLIYKLTNRTLIAALSGLIFAINTAPFHAVTYLAGGVTHVHGATFFFLLSLILFAKYMESGYRKKFLFFSILSIFLALLFMEYVAFYFFFVPICYLIFAKGRKGSALFKDIALIVILGIIFFSVRVFTQKIHVYGSHFVGTRTIENPDLRVSSPLFDFFRAIFLNTCKLLPRVLYQVWMTEDIRNKTFASFRSFVVFSYVMSSMVMGFAIATIYILKRLGNYRLIRVLLCAIVLTLVGAFPAYIFPTFPDVIDSRYLYLSSLGFSVLFAIVLVTFSDIIYKFLARKKIKAMVYPLIISLVMVPFAVKNYRHMNWRLKDTVIVSKMRQKILKQVLSYYPYIKPKSIFYTPTNLSAPGMPWPFSFAYTLLVMYTYHTDYNGADFFKSDWFTTVGQGYQDRGKLGFGTFYDFNSMMDTLRQYNLSEENVYAVCWEATPDSKRNLQQTGIFPPIYEGTLVNITDEIRPMIKRLLKSNKQVAIEKIIEESFSPKMKIGFDRSSKATFVNSSGLIETAEYGIPRITNGGSGIQQGLLIEGYSTNFLLFSEEFNNDIWKKSPGVRVNANSNVSPDGKRSADELIFKDNAEYLEQQIRYKIRDPENTNYTFSVYLKSNAGKNVDLVIENSEGVKKNLTVTAGPKWQRFELTDVGVVGGPITARITGASGSIYAWGAQLEEFPNATSYIYTDAKIHFRAGDVVRAGLSKNIPMSKGSVSLWFKAGWNPDFSLNHVLFYNGDNTYQNNLCLEATPNALRFRILDSQSQTKYIDYNWNFAECKKRGWNHVAATWRNGDLKLYFNGQSVGTAVGPGSGIAAKGMDLANWPLRIGVSHGWYYNQADAIISQLALFDKPLSSGEIQSKYNSQKSTYFSNK